MIFNLTGDDFRFVRDPHDRLAKDFIGTDRADNIASDGTWFRHLFGGLGSDAINPGIPDFSDLPDHFFDPGALGGVVPRGYIIVYGSASLPGFHHDSVEYDSRREARQFDGNDWINLGAGIAGDGGNGRNLYDFHADIPFRFKSFAARVNPNLDDIRFSHRGLDFDISQIKYTVEDTPGPGKTAWVSSYMIESGDTARHKQFFVVTHNDDPRDPVDGPGYFPVKFFDENPRAEIRDVIYDGATPGHQNSDIFDQDQWIF